MPSRAFKGDGEREMEGATGTCLAYKADGCSPMSSAHWEMEYQQRDGAAVDEGRWCLCPFLFRTITLRLLMQDKLEATTSGPDRK